jgi:hypothetical protein
MGSTNGCESWSVYAIGQIIAAYGYVTGMLTMSAVSVAAICLLFCLKKRDQGKSPCCDFFRHGDVVQWWVDVLIWFARNIMISASGETERSTVGTQLLKGYPG